MYAIVRSGGRQHKVAVGDVVEIDKVADEAGSSIELTPLLVVDGESVTSDKDAFRHRAHCRGRSHRGRPGP